ncbi:MAG: sucrose phosphorylase domain-containing protein, partial [Bifidobacterium sp.]
DTTEIDRNLERPVVKALNALCRLRNSLDAFDGEFTFSTADDSKKVILRWEGQHSTAQLIFTPALAEVGEGTSPSLLELTWSDENGEYGTHDLLDDPPEIA